MIEVSNLSKEERVETIFKNVLKKELMNLSYSPQYSVIDDIELATILKSIEDRIHADIRNGKDLVKKDLDAIFALSLTITTLEELLK